MDELFDIRNQVYTEQPLTFNVLLPQTVNGKAVESGAILRDNGDVFFRIYAPATEKAVVEIDDAVLPLEKTADGFHEGLWEFSPANCGYKNLHFLFDGQEFLVPYVQVTWTQNRPMNYIDIPDPATPYVQLRDVPHGSVSRELFYAEPIGKWQRCMVYTPAGYQKGSEEYPVLYLQHGMTENEMCWVYNGRVSYILDNLIAEGKCRPFIVVMCDGMVKYSYDMNKYDNAFERVLLESCIPFIERTYRVKADKWNRALAGLSMGASQTSHIGLAHPDVFAYLGIFSGGLCVNRQGVWNPHIEKLRNLDWARENFRLIYHSIGSEDVNARFSFENDDAFCAETGLDKLELFRRVTHEGQKHTWNEWRRAIYDFAQLIF